MTFLLSGILAAAFAAAPNVPEGWTDGYVMANGIRIHYWRTGGAKPPLLMAHGSSDDGLCWTNLARELVNDFDVILWDARGHGLSDPPRAGDAPDAMVEDMAGLIRELKLVKPVIMGHSMGSATAAWFAAKYPGVPRAVILEDPFLGGSRPGTSAADREKRRADTLARNNMTLEQLVEGCMKNSPKWGLSECQYWAPSKRRHHPDTSLASLGARPAMKDLFAKITAPTLIIKADAPPEVRKENEAVTGVLKDGRIVHVDGAGHNVRREGKAATIAALKQFFGRL